MSSEEILAHEIDRIGTIEANNFVQTTHTINLPETSSELTRVSGVATYQEDGIVRRAASLQKTHDALDTQARINSALATQLNVNDGGHIMIKQDNQDIRFTVIVDDGVAEQCVWIPAASTDSTRLGALFASIKVEAG
jgi:NADH-quinone oxidoreductase subunit G